MWLLPAMSVRPFFFIFGVYTFTAPAQTLQWPLSLTRPDFNEFFHWASWARSSQFNRAQEENYEPGKKFYAKFYNSISLDLLKQLTIKWRNDKMIITKMIQLVKKIGKTTENLMIFHLFQSISLITLIPSHQWQRASRAQSLQNMRAWEQNRASGSGVRFKIRPVTDPPTRMRLG